MPCDGEQECFSQLLVHGTGRDEGASDRPRAHEPASQPSARTYRSKAGMAASHSSASPSTDSSKEQTQQAETSGATPAAGMQQFFDAWLNAWRALGAAPGGNGTPFAMPQVPPAQGAAPWSLPQMPSFSGAFPGTFPASFPGLGSFPGFPGMPDFSKLAAGAMPAMPSLAGLNMPAAAIPPERLQKLQADYTREAMVLLQQASGNGDRKSVV